MIKTLCPKHKGKDTILFPDLCCLVQDMIRSFMFPLSFDPYSQFVITLHMRAWGVNFHRVLNYWEKKNKKQKNKTKQKKKQSGHESF